MSFDDDLIACAQIVEKGDPDRFAATMAAPVEARRVLFPIYAFNVEVARAPWVTQEPLIAEMRLQWWQDALDEIAGGGSVRRHEVVTPLSRVLPQADAVLLRGSIEARRRDAARESFATLRELASYLSDTSGALMWVATRALDPETDWGPPVHDADNPDNDQSVQRSNIMRARAVGTSLGLANYLLAVPDFLARGINPLPEMTEAEFADYLGARLQIVTPGKYALAQKPNRAQRIAELSAWRARGVLKRALRDPAAVPEGRLNEAPVVRQMSLLWRSLRV